MRPIRSSNCADTVSICPEPCNMSAAAWRLHTHGSSTARLCGDSRSSRARGQVVGLRGHAASPAVSSAAAAARLPSDGAAAAAPVPRHVTFQPVRDCSIAEPVSSMSQGQQQLCAATVSRRAQLAAAAARESGHRLAMEALRPIARREARVTGCKELPLCCRLSWPF